MTTNVGAWPSKARSWGRKILDQLATIATPETILRWHQELIARHWDYCQRRKSAGRPSTSPKIVELVLRFAKENPTYVKWADMWSWNSHACSWTGLIAASFT